MTRKLKILTCLIIVSTFCFGFEGTWKGGVAKIRITPKQSMWMAGYSSRTTPSDGTYQDLWAKALALRDNQGKQIILITLDLLVLRRQLLNVLKKCSSPGSICRRVTS
jgi:hypothetical protein